MEKRLPQPMVNATANTQALIEWLLCGRNGFP
jgi:hypothetical protein